MRTKLFSFTLVILGISLSATKVDAQATYTLKATPKTAAWDTTSVLRVEK